MSAKLKEEGGRKEEREGGGERWRNGGRDHNSVRLGRNQYVIVFINCLCFFFYEDILEKEGPMSILPFFLIIFCPQLEQL